ncbi:MAG: amidohydrolase family protein [Chloroflexi bacterium]|nr:amidohydrolase family protein [Chloroflexota bacterium]
MSPSEQITATESGDPAPLYFDCYAVVGPRGKKDPRERWRTEELLAEMTHCGIHGALISHGLARHYDPAYGNRLLLAELARSDRLFGYWALLPDHVGEMPAPPELVREMRIHHIVAGKLYPKTHRFALDDRTCGRLLQALEAEQIPLLLEIAETDFTTVAALCERHPRLAVLLQGCWWDNERLLLPLLDSFENLYVEFSSLQANFVLERLAARLGPERLLLGTEAPIKSPGAAKALIDYADLDEHARVLIAGGNLARLLGTRPPRVHCSIPAGDRVLLAARAGRPVADLIPDADVIDAHAHPVHEGGAEVGVYSMPRGDIGSMFELYDRLEIRTTCISSWLGITADSHGGSTVTATAVRRNPHRTIGCATIDPNYVEDVAAEVDWVAAQPGLRGVKPYFPRNGIPYDDPSYRPWWEYANAHRRFALMHTSGPNFGRQIRSLAQTYPNVSFLLAHTCGSFATVREYAGFARDLPNVFFEITLTPVPPGGHRAPGGAGGRGAGPSSGRIARCATHGRSSVGWPTRT